MTPFFDIDSKILKASEKAIKKTEKEFKKIDEITEFNQQKVISAFIKHGVSESHFTSTTGYGYGDRGRETLDKIWADVFGAEDALVRHNFTCGTHTLATALFVDSLSHRTAFNGTPIHTNRNFTSSNCDCIILQH